MSTMSATEASRSFSALLDAVERGEEITITRGNRAIAQIRPARQRTGSDLRRALEDLPALDDAFEADIASAGEFVRDDWQNPWRDA